MLAMRHYLYYKSNIILRKINRFSIFKCECQFANQVACEWCHQFLWHVRVHSVGTTYLR